KWAFGIYYTRMTDAGDAFEPERNLALEDARGYEAGPRQHRKNRMSDENAESTPKEKFASAAAEKQDAGIAQPPESSLWKGGYSPKAMYGSWLLTALASIGIVVGGFFFVQGENESTIWLILGAVILVLWILVIGLFLYRRIGMSYELTTQRFIHQSGILLRTTDRIEVIDIDDVSFAQGLIQRMLGVGRITITGSDRSHPELVLHGIDQVAKIATLIDDVRRDERKKRSLHIEAI
ncbi:MAG: PH domain-containing protein, partial [Planctomycetota bacterium]